MADKTESCKSKYMHVPSDFRFHKDTVLEIPSVECELAQWRKMQSRQGTTVNAIIRDNQKTR